MRRNRDAPAPMRDADMNMKCTAIDTVEDLVERRPDLEQSIFTAVAEDVRPACAAAAAGTVLRAYPYAGSTRACERVWTRDARSFATKRFQRFERTEQRDRMESALWDVWKPGLTMFSVRSIDLGARSRAHPRRPSMSPSGAQASRVRGVHAGPRRRCVIPATSSDPQPHGAQ